MNDPIVTGVLYSCAILLAISAVEHYFRKSIVPALCWVMVAGALYGIIRLSTDLPLPRLSLDPQVVLFIFLPILIFDSARKLRLADLRTEAVPIGFFATAGVILSMFLIGVPFAWLMEVPLLDALLFGAVLSATDPVAVTALFGNFPFPRRLKTIVEGESLLNDGMAVILFSLLSAGTFQDQAFSFVESLAGLGGAVGGAVLIGFVMGWAGAALIRHWHVLHDRFLGALLPLIVVYLAFAVADHFFHASGVIAVMTATLTLFHLKIRHSNRDPSQGTGDHATALGWDRFIDKFWDFLNNLANAILFFMLGAELGQHHFPPYLSVLPLVILILLVARSGTVYLGSGLLRMARQGLPVSWQHVLNLSGLKGALSAALILLIPPDYAHREAFLCAAFSLIAFTMIANSVGMQLYLKRATVPDAG